MAWSYVSAPELSEQQFFQWRKMLENRIGIRLGAHQKQFLQSQISMRMRELGEEDFTKYFKRVNDSLKGQLEWSILLDRLVVKQTSFFRHKPSMNFVCSHLQDKINEDSLNDSYDMWSLGCSTGEEPYTLGMLVNECFELARREPYFGITATDVSRVAISLARTAQFSERKLEFVPQALRYKYFSQCGRDQYVFDHEVVEKMCFSNTNILQVEEMPRLFFDVIYCQNLLVYFQQDLRKTLLNTIANKLKPGGILVLGLGEVIDWQHPEVERVTRSDVQVYQRSNKN